MFTMLSKFFKSTTTNHSNILSLSIANLHEFKVIPRQFPSRIRRLENYKTKSSFSTSRFVRSTEMNSTIGKLPFGLTKKKIVLIGIGIGGVIGGSYGFFKEPSKAGPAIGNESGKNDYILQDVPSHPVSRSIKSTTDNSGLKITIYQYQTCPFCCKVRAYLDYYGFSYDIVEVNSISKKETKWTSYKKVPFLIIEQDNSKSVFQLKDSSMIISTLQSLLVNKDSDLETVLKAYPILQSQDESGKIKTEIANKYSILYGRPTHSSKKTLEERKWREWTDDVYVHLLSPNIYRTLTESFQAFSWFNKAGHWEEYFTTWERFIINYGGPSIMYFIGKMVKRRYHLKDDVRLSLYDESYKIQKLTSKQQFIGGSEPNLSDLSLYGVLSAIEGCDAFRDLLENVNIESWYYSVKDLVQKHEGNKYLLKRFNEN